MKRNLFRLVECLCFLLAALLLLFIAYIRDPWQIITAVFAGGCFSLFASTLIQELVFKEQSEMIESVTVDAKNIQSLPEAFHKLSWIAIASVKSCGEVDKQTEWRLQKLTKIGGAGPRFVVYSHRTKNLTKNDVTYTSTFLGSQNCVICAVGTEYETTSTLTFDTQVPTAGVYFAVAYTTDWSGARNTSLAIVGTNEINDFADLSKDVFDSFKNWYKSVGLRIESAYSEFPFPVDEKEDFHDREETEYKKKVDGDIRIQAIDSKKKVTKERTKRKHKK